MTKRATYALYLLTVLLVVGYILAQLAVIGAGAQERGTERSRTEAVVKCSAPLTEDSAALAELVVFERASNGTIAKLVYRCGTP